MVFTSLKLLGISKYTSAITMTCKNKWDKRQINILFQNIIFTLKEFLFAIRNKLSTAFHF